MTTLEQGQLGAQGTVRDGARVDDFRGPTLTECTSDQGQGESGAHRVGISQEPSPARAHAHARKEANIRQGANCPSRPQLSLPAWFQPTPFPYQLDGAIRAAHHGHTLLADEPGLGKTLQALATAVLLGAERILVIAPPGLLANWGREITRTGHLDHIPDSQLLIIHPGVKPRSRDLPAAGYIVVSDALIVARPTLAGHLRDWAPDVLAIDEAHRMKNPSAKRTRVTIKIAAAAGTVLAITGTPIISTPLDVLPLLEMLDHLRWFPGGTKRSFEGRYVALDYWGKPRPVKRLLPELHAILEAFVWTRRTKADVLTELPAKLRGTHTITPSSRDLADAHRDLDDAIDDFLDTHPTPSVDDVKEWASDNLRHVSRMRRATGLAKLEAATDWIRDHHDGAPDRPLIAWAIHRDVITGLAEQLTGHMRVATIHGGTSHTERDQIVQDFQAGRIDVLIAQIVAAGVGLTLTRSSDVLFVETDWTPAAVVQAEDRVHRIGQTQPVQITTIVAEHTLDPKIHATLATSIEILDQLTPGSDHAVTATTGDQQPTTARDVLVRLVLDRHITRLTRQGAAA